MHTDPITETNKDMRPKTKNLEITLYVTLVINFILDLELINKQVQFCRVITRFPLLHIYIYTKICLLFRE